MLSRTPEPGEGGVVDADLDRAVAVLRLHTTEGRLTLDEFSDRCGEAYAARTRAELDLALRDLPVPWNEPPAKSDLRARARAPRGTRLERSPRADAIRERLRKVRWHVAVFSENVRRGQFRLDDESAAVAVFGECVIDLTDARIDAPEVVITAWAIFGEVTIIVPEGIDVEVTGVAIFGEKRSDTAGAPPLPGSPRVRVQAGACFGAVIVRAPRASDHRRHSDGRASASEPDGDGLGRSLSEAE